MKDRGLTELEKLLVEVAIFAPAKKSEFANEARIPWELIQRIRSKLNQLGVDWMHVRREMHRIQQERRKAG